MHALLRPWSFAKALIALGFLTASQAACGGASHGGPDNGADGGVDDATADGPGAPTDAALTPGVFTRDGGCLALASACSQNAECCSGTCSGGVCAYPACTPDHLACTSNGSCCSQSCVGGACAPLNTACSTLGNPCAANAECCSHLCTGGACAASSFCGQPGDACATAADCCTGTCTVGSGQALGTCGSAPPTGPANCGLADGQLCEGTASDGGIVRNDAGLPSCGGPCCSRACAPWGPTGVLVCQPASGCHVVGDLCTRDGDCCGSAGLPGGSGKPVTCVITPPRTVGVCRNPMGCKPDGDVCKLQTSSCNSSCDCCSGNCETQDTCKQDNVGVPRCAAAQCVSAGGSCASSANCCGGAPCVPNPVPGASPPFVCSTTQCMPACAGCTNNADCCPGTSCNVAPGSTLGICGPCGGGGGGDAGPPPDAGTTPTDGGGAGSDAGCALYGQICQTSADCCNGVPCTNGRCQVPVF